MLALRLEKRRGIYGFYRCLSYRSRLEIKPFCLTDIDGGAKGASIPLHLTEAEDFMGKMRILALSASKGSQGVQVSKRMHDKWLKAIHFTLLDPGLWFDNREFGCSRV